MMDEAAVAGKEWTMFQSQTLYYISLPVLNGVLNASWKEYQMLQCQIRIRT